MATLLLCRDAPILIFSADTYSQLFRKISANAHTNSLIFLKGKKYIYLPNNAANYIENRLIWYTLILEVFSCYLFSDTLK